jgi:TctA family transporter
VVVLAVGGVVVASYSLFSSPRLVPFTLALSTAEYVFILVVVFIIFFVLHRTASEEEG